MRMPAQQAAAFVGVKMSDIPEGKGVGTRIMDIVQGNAPLEMPSPSALP